MADSHEQLPAEWDWTRQSLQDGATLGIIIFADQSLLEDEEGMPAEATFDDVAKQLRAATGAQGVKAVPVDPFVGAGGIALQVAMQFIGYAADVITIGALMVSLKPRLQAAVRILRKRFTSGQRSPGIIYSGLALQVLVVADLCESERLDPTAVDRVDCLMHASRPAEPSEWLRPTDAAYTITVTMSRDDGFYHLWSYLVTCYANVVAVTHFPIPTANASHWYEVDDRILRPLRDIV
jgi:hypothetical protein